MGGATLREFAELCERLERTQGRNSKVGLVASYLKNLDSEDARIAAYLLVGKVSEEKEGSPLNVGWATISDVLNTKGVKTLVESTLTLSDLWSSLRSISQLSGPGSRDRKKATLEVLFSRMSELEKKWLLRGMFGEMRHGVNVGLLLDALAMMAGVNEEGIRRADMLVGDVGELAALAVSGGIRGIGLRLFSPVRPMLAETCEGIAEAITMHNGKVAFEPKYDGVRLQIHKSRDEVRIFTRRLSDVTQSLPDIVEVVRSNVRRGSAILDGEVVAIDSSGKALPFQDTMRRIGREHNVEAAVKQLPLMLRVFDALFIDGETIIDRPYVQRRRILEEMVDESILTEQLLSTDIEEVEGFLRRVLDMGHEGLMAKELHSQYTPGRRGAKWLKIKPADRLDVVIVAAEWGHGRRHRWLSNYHLAVLDEETGRYEMVGKTFKGLTDIEFQEMTRRLQQIKIMDEDWGVIVRPEIVVEVAYNEIQRSPHYNSGYALRFARITRIRSDKSHRDIDTLQRLKSLYEKQFEKKGKARIEEH